MGASPFTANTHKATVDKILKGRIRITQDDMSDEARDLLKNLLKRMLNTGLVQDREMLMRSSNIHFSPTLIGIWLRTKRLTNFKASINNLSFSSSNPHSVQCYHKPMMSACFLHSSWRFLPSIRLQIRYSLRLLKSIHSKAFPTLHPACCGCISSGSSLYANNIYQRKSHLRCSVQFVARVLTELIKHFLLKIFWSLQILSETLRFIEVPQKLNKRPLLSDFVHLRASLMPTPSIKTVHYDPKQSKI